MIIKLKNNHLYFENYKLRCAIGKRGISFKKREGDKKTPKGTFKLKYILYRKDRITNLKTKFKKIKIKKKWDGVMTLSRITIIKLLVFRSNIVLKSYG